MVNNVIGEVRNSPSQVHQWDHAPNSPVAFHQVGVPRVRSAASLRSLIAWDSFSARRLLQRRHAVAQN